MHIAPNDRLEPDRSCGTNGDSSDHRGIRRDVRILSYCRCMRPKWQNHELPLLDPVESTALQWCGMHRFCPRAVAVSTALCVLFSSTVSLGQSVRSKVAVIDVNGNVDGESCDIQYFVEKGVRTSDALVEIVFTDAVLNVGRQQNQAQNVAFGNAALLAAEAAYADGNFQLANEQASMATLYYEQSHAFLDKPSHYLDALVLQGLSLARSGSRRAGVELLVRAFVVNPKLTWDASDTSAKWFEEAKKKASERNESSVTVVTAPSLSRVYVDGRYRGISPAYRPGLKTGRHFVRVERQGYARAGQTVDTSEVSDVKADFALKPAAKKQALDGLLEGIQSELGRVDLPATGSTMRLKSLLLVDYVVLLRTDGPASNRKVELWLYDLNTGRRIKEMVTVVDWERRDRQSKVSVMASVRTALAAINAPQSTDLTSPVTDSGIETTWWFWTIIGVAVTGVAVGLALGLQADDAPPGVPNDGNGGLVLQF